MAEVRNDYTDELNYVHIDYWSTESDDEEGRTIAIVCKDTKKVFFIDNRFRKDPLVIKIIEETLKNMQYG